MGNRYEEAISWLQKCLKCDSAIQTPALSVHHHAAIKWLSLAANQNHLLASFYEHRHNSTHPGGDPAFKQSSTEPGDAPFPEDSKGL